MDTKNARAIRQRRVRTEEQRVAAVRRRIADGEIAPVSNDTKWEKIFAELEHRVSWDAPVLVKLVDSEAVLNRPGLFGAYVDAGEVEHPEGLLRLVFVEWVSFQSQSPPRFRFQADFDFDGATLKIYGYRRLQQSM